MNINCLFQCLTRVGAKEWQFFFTVWCSWFRNKGDLPKRQWKWPKYPWVSGRWFRMREILGCSECSVQSRTKQFSEVPSIWRLCNFLRKAFLLTHLWPTVDIVKTPHDVQIQSWARSGCGGVAGPPAGQFIQFVRRVSGWNSGEAPEAKGEWQELRLCWFCLLIVCFKWVLPKPASHTCAITLLWNLKVFSSHQYSFQRFLWVCAPRERPAGSTGMAPIVDSSPPRSPLSVFHSCTYLCSPSLGHCLWKTSSPKGSRWPWLWIASLVAIGIRNQRPLRSLWIEFQRLNFGEGIRDLISTGSF